MATEEPKRRKRGANGTHETVIFVPCSEKLRDEVEAAGLEDGESIAEWVRNTLSRVLKRRKAKAASRLPERPR